MANILVATTPSSGHINPLLPLVENLAQAGHQLCWYTGQAFKDDIVQVGAQFEPIRRAVDHGGMSKEEAFPQLKGLHGLADFLGSWKAIFLDNAPKHMQDMLDILDHFPADVLLSDETSFGVGFVREKTGLPHVVVSTSVYFYRSRDTAPLGLGMLPDDSFFGRLRNRLLAFGADYIRLRELRTHAVQIRRSVALPPLPGGVLQNVNLKPNLYLMATVPEFEYPRSDLIPNTHFIGSLNGYAEYDFVEPSWWGKLKSSRAVVHVTQGTVNNRDVHQLLLPTLQGLAQEEDLLVIASTGGVLPDEIGLDAHAENIIIEPFIAHNHLLPHVAVMVTNGGFGGVQRALHHGVPLVVCGATEEKPDVAARVEWAGVGLNLRELKPSPQMMRDAVLKILSEKHFQERAQSLQRSFAALDAPNAGREWIEKLIQESKSGA